MKAEDLNFPQAEYSPEELPASIAQLAEFIKEDQVHNAIIASYTCSDNHGIKCLEPFSMHQYLSRQCNVFWRVTDNFFTYWVTALIRHHLVMLLPA